MERDDTMPTWHQGRAVKGGTNGPRRRRLGGHLLEQTMHISNNIVPACILNGTSKTRRKLPTGPSNRPATTTAYAITRSVIRSPLVCSLDRVRNYVSWSIIPALTTHLYLASPRLHPSVERPASCVHTCSVRAMPGGCNMTTTQHCKLSLQALTCALHYALNHAHPPHFLKTRIPRLSPLLPLFLSST